MRSPVAWSVLLFAPFAACTRVHAPVPAAALPAPSTASIVVEVYDPVTNWVWENVSVRIVEADQEWSQLTHVSPYVDWWTTDSYGQVYFDAYMLAAAGVGFLEDGAGRALLYPESHEDEATVWLEIDAVGFSPVFVAVELCWCDAQAFVSVPF